MIDRHAGAARHARELTRIALVSGPASGGAPSRRRRR
jgi:hypothetical protein